MWKTVWRCRDDRRSGEPRTLKIGRERHDKHGLKHAVERVALPDDDGTATCLFLRAVSAEVGPTKGPRVSPEILMIEIRSPAVQISSRQFDIFRGSSGETREVPARRIRLSNHDHTNTFAGPEIQRLGGSEEAILVQRFDGTHALQDSIGARRLILRDSGCSVRPTYRRSAAGARGSPGERRARLLERLVGRRPV